MATEGQGITRVPGALIRCSVPVPITVPAQATTDFSFNVPAGARSLAFRTKTPTAFGAATDAQISVGKTVGGAEYVAAVSVKAQGEVIHTGVASGMGDLDTVPGANGSMMTMYARLTQSGTASATGAATLYAEYSIPV